MQRGGQGSNLRLLRLSSSEQHLDLTGLTALESLELCMPELTSLEGVSSVKSLKVCLL